MVLQSFIGEKNRSIQRQPTTIQRQPMTIQRQSTIQRQPTTTQRQPTTIHYRMLSCFPWEQLLIYSIYYIDKKSLDSNLT
jgi:hypothetical protein